MSPRAPDLSGIALDGRYELRELIGEGTFGRVYRGYDRRLARPVAVKVIKPWWAEDPEWVASLEREARLLASLSDPGIVQIYDIGQATEGVFYVAELIDGESLASRLARGPIAPGEAAELAAALARALARAHERGIVHRDVKPANVLLASDGRVKLGDFGVAQLAEGSTAGAGTVAGTPRYMAPEQAQGGRLTPATDVYGLGVVLYEMLAGEPPFKGETPVELAVAHLRTPPPRLPEPVPRALRRIVERALAKDPRRRYADGAAMHRALASAGVAGAGTASATGRGRERGAPGGPVARTLVAPLRGRRRTFSPAARRHRLVAVTLVALVLGGMLAGALLLRRGSAIVPRVTGHSRLGVDGALRRAGLHARFSYRYSGARRGTAIAQQPPPRASAPGGSVVEVVLSAGPAPVAVPPVTGTSASAAGAALAAAHLRASVTTVPAPGVTPGTVTAQLPAAGSLRPPGTVVDLQVAEVPQWRTLTRLSGSGAGQSVAFRIRGRSWRLVTSMHYQGTCTFIFFCSGPQAKVVDPGSGAVAESFGLDSGDGHARVFTDPPGVYQVKVAPGNDGAAWSIVVQDRY